VEVASDGAIYDLFDLCAHGKTEGYLISTTIS
jgi:hypothetical protein